MPMLLQTPANFKIEKKKIITGHSISVSMPWHAALQSLSLSFTNLSPFSYTVFKMKSSTLTSPGRESCPPTAAETSGKQQPMLPAMFFGLLLVRGATLLPGFCSPLKFQCSKQYSIRLDIPAQHGAPSIIQKILQYTSLSCRPSHQPLNTGVSVS